MSSNLSTLLPYNLFKIYVLINQVNVHEYFRNKLQ